VEREAGLVAGGGGGRVARRGLNCGWVGREAGRVAGRGSAGAAKNVEPGGVSGGRSTFWSSESTPNVERIPDSRSDSTFWSLGGSKRREPLDPRSRSTFCSPEEQNVEATPDSGFDSTFCTLEV
jgi:hypothetical protein